MLFEANKSALNWVVLYAIDELHCLPLVTALHNEQRIKHRLVFDTYFTIHSFSSPTNECFLAHGLGAKNWHTYILMTSIYEIPNVYCSQKCMRSDKCTVIRTMNVLISQQIGAYLNVD